MAQFNGYLFKAANGPIFPHKYIEASSWSSTPNQREEIKAYRDDNTRNLTRVTASGKKSQFSFEITDNLHLAQVEEILNYFTSNETDHLQRKIRLTYWNNEELTYKTSDFYRPDIPFQIKYITEDDIIYEKLKITFIEY